VGGVLKVDIELVHKHDTDISIQGGGGVSEDSERVHVKMANVGTTFEGVWGSKGKDHSKSTCDKD
jgi:hypothetical protein